MKSEVTADQIEAAVEQAYQLEKQVAMVSIYTFLLNSVLFGEGGRVNGAPQ